jgi:hypothetical protein
MADLTKVLDDGFYACSVWPYWFQILTHRDGSKNIWGFSIWKNQPGYRTLSIPFTDWLSKQPHRRLGIVPDRNRVSDLGWIADYRPMHEVGQGGDTVTDPIKVLDELSVAARNMRHWYPKERVIPVEIETYEALVAIARAALDLDGHTDVCEATQHWRGCTCGYSALEDAFAKLGEVTP